MPLHTQILFHSHGADLLTFQEQVLRPKGMIYSLSFVRKGHDWQHHKLMHYPVPVLLFIPVLFFSFMIDEEVDSYITFFHICYRIDRTGPIAASSIADKALYQA
jgi:hypothetical protein